MKLFQKKKTKQQNKTVSSAALCTQDFNPELQVNSILFLMSHLLKRLQNNYNNNNINTTTKF